MTRTQPHPTGLGATPATASPTEETEVEVERPGDPLSVVRVVGAVTDRPETLAYVDIGETGAEVRVRARRHGDTRRYKCDAHPEAERCPHTADALAAWQHVEKVEAEEAAAAGAPLNPHRPNTRR